jgi:hypothetical protein
VGYRRLLVLPDTGRTPVDTVTLHPGVDHTYRWGPGEAHSAPAHDPAGAADLVVATMRPRPVRVVVRQLTDLQARYRQQRVALLADLADLDPDLPGTIAAITDPVERAVAATRALAIEDVLLTVRDRAVRELAQPEPDGGLGVPQAEIARRLGYSRQLVFDILRREPAAAIPARPAGPVVDRLAAISDPWLRADAANLALATHRRRKAALAQQQRAAVRRAVTEHHVSQAELARRLGKDPSWIGVLLDTKGSPDVAERRRPAESGAMPKRTWFGWDPAAGAGPSRLPSKNMTAPPNVR